MNIAERIERNEPEDERLDYKAKGVENWKIVKDLVAFANAEGGTVVIGVPEKDGKPAKYQNVRHPHSRADQISDTISSRVSPVLDFERSTIPIGDKTILSLTVPHSERLFSFKPPEQEEPVFPIRHTSTTYYMDGQEVNQYLEKISSQEETRTSDSQLLRLSDNESETEEFFIKSPDGHISEICIFSNVYYPGNPVRISTRTDYIPTEAIEHIFGTLEELFGISHGRSAYTINQSNGAWIGRGFRNFVSSLRSQSDRYERATNEEEYDLNLYGNEQAVFVSDFGMVYPESVLILYVAPFVENEGYRHFTANFLINGQPIDIRPLIEFAEKTDLALSTSQEVNVPTDGVKNPNRIPVEVTERVSRTDILTNEEHESIDSILCQNPFYGKPQVLNRELNLEGLNPIAKYRQLFAFLDDWDSPESTHNYESQRFIVRDWNQFTEGIYANVKEIRFDVNW